VGRPDGDWQRRAARPLLALHAATEIDELWLAFRTLARTLWPVHRVTLFLGHIGMGEARLALTDPPIDQPEVWYEERGRLNPFSPFIERNRGLRFYRFSDVLPSPAEFRASEFHRRFAVPEGWDKGVSALYWSRGEVRAMFSLYRSPEQPEFSDVEMAVLREVYAFVGVAIDRVKKLHTERLLRRGLEEFNRNIPVGLLYLDWRLGVEFANPEALRVCALWNLGPSRVRSVNPREVFELPPAIRNACETLKEGIRRRNPKTLRAHRSDTAAPAAPHPQAPGARITVVNSPASLLAPPRFLVVFDGGAPHRAREAGAVPSPAAWRDLSPREREIARGVCEGLSNGEIAKATGKSVLTVKTQLNAVFRKVGVGSRTRLVSVLGLGGARSAER
jgi:DNA-binding CsgD family transcriptional regulator